jgi:putative hydrolase of the HAD superfamily
MRLEGDGKWATSAHGRVARMLSDLSRVRSIVFDLDGTLYTSPPIANEIMAAAEKLVAKSRGISLEDSRELLATARRRLAETLEQEPTLTRTCMQLGIDVPEFHRALQGQVHPEKYLQYDPILSALLDSLRDPCDLYLYTNNNLYLAQKILALLGVGDLFQRLYTIEFTWAPKPDPESLQRVLEDIGGPPESFLFVGDRAEVDLGEAAALGIPTLLVRETADLLQVHKLLGMVP